MKRVNVQFIREDGARDIDVLFKASEEDDQVRAIMERTKDPLAGKWQAMDASGAIVMLPEEHIISVSASNKRLRIATDEGIYWLKETLQNVEKGLNPSMFLRISRYEIINLRMVRRFDFSNTGMLRVEMVDGTETWASRRFIAIIRERLQKREW